MGVDEVEDRLERTIWVVDVDGSRREVELSWTYWGGYRGVRVDGRVVAESTLPMRGRSEQAFALDGASLVVRTRPSTRLSPFFVLELEVDGRLVPPLPGPRGRWQR